ncbi:MAG TPA: Tn3 family transposase [Acidobacteriaceae bacterium]
MPVSFLTTAQREGYGRYAADPSPEDLSRYFHFDEADRAWIAQKRGNHNRLGYATQLATVRFLGTFLDDATSVPQVVASNLAMQLNIAGIECLKLYRDNRTRWAHTTEIRARYGYCEFVDPSAGFRLTRWLYALCWTGTERPSVLFDRATAWLLTHKVLLPGSSVLERFVAQLRSRVELRVWRLLGQGVTRSQRTQLEALLAVPEGSRASWIDKLRSGPVTVSGPALTGAVLRLKSLRDMGIELPLAGSIPQSRLAALARFAGTTKVTALGRLPPVRRLATLVAFIHCLEATAQDDAIEVLEMVLRDLFGDALKEDKKARLRTLKDLDRAAMVLLDVCRAVLNDSLPDDDLRSCIYATTPRDTLEQAVENAGSLVRPPEDVYYDELRASYRRVRRFLPTLLKHIHFGASPSGNAVAQALDWLRDNLANATSGKGAPREVIRKPWQQHVLDEGDRIDLRAYTFCVLDELRSALRHREVFVTPSWRYADPRAGLLAGAEWESTRPIVCRTLGLSAAPQATLTAMTEELDRTYRQVAARLPENPAVRFEAVGDKKELVLSPLDKLEEPASLLALRAAVASLLPRVDLPEILVEIAARTGFTQHFTHVSERTARVDDLSLSLCAVLLAEASNTGPEPLIRNDVAALKRDRLSWVSQNYIRDQTLIAANAALVSAQNRSALAKLWGGGEVASADGLRFVVPVRTVHAAPNPKYFGTGRGVTWYNLVSNQFSGLNAITVPGTLRDSLVLLSVVLEQQTELNPTRIMTDSGAYSDVIFGIFRMLGYRFSPRLADMGGTRFWRIDPRADYGDLNHVARQKINLRLIEQHWDDLLRLAGSLKLGKVSAAGIMRTLQVSDRPTKMAQALAEFGRIEKTLNALTYIDDETKRRETLTQLNRGEGRHSVARAVFHGKRGELRQHYREGQEDQLGALGLVVNVIALWNTLYMEAALTQLRKQGFPVRNEDVVRLSPLTCEHINMLGRYSFTVPDAVARGEMRPLRNPADDNTLGRTLN